MDQHNELLLAALRCALKGEVLPEQPEISGETWEKVFLLARKHHLLPMIFEAVYAQPGVMVHPSAGAVRKGVMQSVFAQTVKTAEFQELYTRLLQAGVSPLVVKGLVCRNLYPLPDHRISGDEDVLIPAEQFQTAHRVMTEFGMTTTEAEENFEAAYEIPYRKAGSPLYIELHKYLFSPDSGAYGHLNDYFSHVHGNAREEEIQGCAVASLAPDDHLFYLICHSFKHFLHSGFGIRQVCDIVLYARRYGGEIHWEQLMEKCRQIRADRFAGALFRIGREYLDVDLSDILPESWNSMEVDPLPMVEELMEAGVYGGADRSRKHSSNITLTAMENQKRGKATSGGVLKSLFPEPKKLEKRYPYLKKHPALVPVAWVSRIITYGRETAAGSNNSAAESIRIGGERVELMKYYGILED